MAVLMKVSKSTDLTTSEVAYMLGVSATSVRDWTNSGLLQSSKTLGGHRRYLREDIESFASKNMGKPLISKSMLKILLIDDDDDFCVFFKDYITSKIPNSEIVIVDNGFSIGNHIASFKPNVIFIDINLPELDGFEICQQIKADCLAQQIKIFVISGDTSVLNRKKALALGADSFINKPLNTELLLYLLGKLTVPLHGKAEE